MFCCHVFLIGVWDSQGTHETQLMINEAENFLPCLFSVMQYFEASDIPVKQLVGRDSLLFCICKFMQDMALE